MSSPADYGPQPHFSVQEHEVRYWTQALGVTKEQLAEAVQQVGNSADRVREYFSKNRH
jgi:hypothetical protein